MKPSDSHAWRNRYLRILTGRADEDFDSQDDLQAIEDLIEEQFLRGVVTKDQDGIIRGATLFTSDDGKTVPTLKGRLFIEDQKAFLRSKTFLGRLKANWPLFSGIVGIIIGWSLGLISPVIQKRVLSQSQHQNDGDRPAQSARLAPVRSRPFEAPAAPITPNPAKP